ncbi:MAG TPA: DHHA1 domain-containing protein [Gemmatimonadales bacterium]|nr:DHHA1 domain-containing protein [Gemmatimonadales bacterium]
MTERLYFNDPYLTGFSARVTAERDQQGRPAVALDRSAFYPEGGGQPADRGMLNEVPVLDVQADDAGTVWHLLSGPLGDEMVQGQVDWPRRFDHMQQHHGQHLLSAAFEELFRLHTVSFHLGPESATIDLDGDPSEDQMLAAESRTNEVIWEDRPVTARLVSREELASLPLRKPPAVEGPIRVVSVPEFDHSACGGTHPRSTGAVGLLHLRRKERRGNETRIEFVCGGRALRDLRIRGGLLTRLGTMFTAGMDDLEAAVLRLRQNEESTRRRLGQVTERLLGFEARELVQQAAAGNSRIVRLIREDLTLDEARLLARLVAELGAIAVVGVKGEKSQLVMARDPGAAGPDCGRIVREALKQFGGRGGGQPMAAQGGVPDATHLERAVNTVADMVEA